MSLTDCECEERRTPPALPLSFLVQALACAALITSLALAHVFVKFRASDLRYSARWLQKQREELENQSRALESRVQALESGARLRQVAVDLGMRDATRRQIDRMDMSRELARRYEQRSWRDPALWDREEPARPGGPLERVMAWGAEHVGEPRAHAQDSP